MTNKCDIIYKLMRAGNYHEKEYCVTVNKEVTSAFLEAMSAGVHIVDKEKNMDVVTRPCTVSKIGKYKFRIVLTQGLNRQTRYPNASDVRCVRIPGDGTYEGENYEY